MRVCLVSNEFAPFHGAGIGTYASLMASAWTGTGHEVEVLTGTHSGVLEDGPRLRPGVRFHVVEAGPRARIGNRAEAYALEVLAILRRLHAARPFDYIEFPDYGGEGAYAVWAHRAGGLAGAVLGVRLHTPRRECRVLNEESWLDEEGARVDALEDWAIRGADVLISPSGSLLEIVRGRLGGAPGWPWEAVVPYPFDRAAVGELLPSQGSSSATDTGGPPIVLYYGRLERRKGVHLLVEAARRMLDCGVHVRFRFIGGDTVTGPSGGSMRRHLERLAGAHAGRGIEFQGPRIRRELGEEIRRAAVVCIPSLWENFPNVVLESMALGACVVGSDAGGIGEIIRDGEDGLLFRAGDGEDLERVLRGITSDGDRRRAIAGAAAGRIAALCDPASVVAQTMAAIEAARPSAARPTESRAAPERVSVVIVVGESDEGLAETLGEVRAQGETVVDGAVVLRGSAGPDRAALVARVEAAARGADLRPLVLEPCGPGRAVREALAHGQGAWVVILEPGDSLLPGSLARLVGAGAEAAWVGGLASWRDDAWGPAPIGFERDLLAAGVLPGPAIFRRSAVERLGESETSAAADEAETLWMVACGLAAAGERWAFVPEVMVSRPAGRGVGPVRARALAGRIDGVAGLRADAGRVARILAARAAVAEQRAEEVEASREALQARLHSIEMGWGGGEPPYGPRRAIDSEEVFRQRFMEENLKYRLADRVNGALKATGIQRPLKALARWARGLARRLAGG